MPDVTQTKRKEEMELNKKTGQLCLAAVMMAMVFVVTRFIQIPIPLGYFNVGNSVILLFCLLISMPYGIAASAFGSALADLLSYPVYTAPTLIIKAIMPFLFYVIIKKFDKNKFAVIIAATISTLIPLFGYTIIGAIIYGSFATGIAQFPGLLLEYIANLVIITALYKPIEGISKRLGL